MKKIYSMLAMACVSASAFALPVQQLKNVSLAEKPQFETSAIKASFEEKDAQQTGKVKIINKNDNSEWSALIANRGEFQFYNNVTMQPLPFNYYPFYNMVVSCQPMNSSTKEVFQFTIAWPSYCAMDDELWALDADGNMDHVDEAKAYAKYGEKAFDAVSYEDFAQIWTSKTFNAMPGLFIMPYIIGPQFTEAATIQIGDNRYYISTAASTGTKWDYSNATSLTWDSFDPTTSEIVLVMDCKYTSSIGGNPIGSRVADLKGEAVVLGFSNITWDTIGQVHIFNGGRQEAGSDWTYNYEQQSSIPLNFYYLAMCDNTMAYRATNPQTGEIDQNYTDLDLPQQGTLYGAPGFRIEEDNHYIFVAGALWAPENSELPYGKWTMGEPYSTKTDAEGYTVPDQMPTAYNLVIAGYNDAAGNQDGFYGLYEGYSQYASIGKSAIGIGDERQGLNFKYASNMSGDYVFTGTYTGEIYYHGTPDKWLDFTMIPATSKGGDYNVLTGDSGVQSVENESPVVSKSFYNFQGQRLNSEPESGMYIIRAVKADGSVKATKVAK